MDCSPPGSSVHGILQARMLEWVAISFSRGSSWPRDWTQVSCIAGRCFTLWATREAQDIASLITWLRLFHLFLSYYLFLVFYSLIIRCLVDILVFILLDFIKLLESMDDIFHQFGKIFSYCHFNCCLSLFSFLLLEVWQGMLMWLILSSFLNVYHLILFKNSRSVMSNLCWIHSLKIHFNFKS